MSFPIKYFLSIFSTIIYFIAKTVLKSILVIPGLGEQREAGGHAGFRVGVPEVATEAADRPRRGKLRQGLEGGG